jgi:photosystem II stability/assembly factor-like uncharacterized protein
MSESALVAIPTALLRIDPERAELSRVSELEGQHPSAVVADPRVIERVWVATGGGGVFRSDDRGATWSPSGLEGENLTSITPSPARDNLIWAGTEPSAIWRSEDGGENWDRCADLETLPSSPEWSFPPRPDTHHVRWIASHPAAPERLWVAIEAGALIRTTDGGRSWTDRVPGGPYDTHELAVHPDAPDVLRSAAGDGYFESRDGGETWTSPMVGLDVGYLRSVAIDPRDPEVVLVSAATHAHKAYVAGRSDGRLYRREGNGRWQRVTDGWPDPPHTVAPLLVAVPWSGELWAADERGLHRSSDGGASWRQVVALEETPHHIRGLALVPPGA